MDKARNTVLHRVITAPRTDMRSNACHAATTLALAVLASVPAPAAANGACGTTPNCSDLGPFTATVVKVNVTRQDSVTAYQGVRTTVRFINTGQQPLVLGYRDRSSSVTDNNGLAYRWSSKAHGIGVVSRGGADAQFILAPGQAREAAFEGVLQYSLRRQVAGNVFTHDITLVELVPVGANQVREVRDHVLSFSGLTANTGFSAPAAATLPADVLNTATGAGAVPAGANDALQTVNKLVDLFKDLKR